MKGENVVNQCAENVYKGAWSLRSSCSRKAGYGPDGKYCSQHAEKFTTGDTETWYRVRHSEYSVGIEPVQVLTRRLEEGAVKPVKTKPRFRCDFCSFKATEPTVRKHEPHCWQNPNRWCEYCQNKGFTTEYCPEVPGATPQDTPCPYCSQFREADDFSNLTEKDIAGGYSSESIR